MDDFVEKTNVHRLYETHVRDFDRDRTRVLMEQRYLDEILDLVGSKPCILDLGCGMGEPIARFLMSAGAFVTGVDAAPAMIALCRKRFPDMDWMLADMRGLALGRHFDAVLAWDSFFHLSPDDQRAMFPVFGSHVCEGGLLLFTSGPSFGEKVGHWYGEALYHASLAPEEYSVLLAEHGFTVLRHRVEDPNCGGHTVWLARKAAA